MSLRRKIQKLCGLILAGGLSYYPATYLYWYLTTPRGQIPFYHDFLAFLAGAWIVFVWFVYLAYALSKEK